MMNRYPFWKYALIAIVVAFGALYALPNLYGEDPAIQVAHSNGDIDTDLLRKVEAVLTKGNFKPTAIALEDGRLLARFDDTETQLAASDYLRDNLNRDHIVALNLASKTPAWLRDFKARPMSLGLDLRGGVHFLMEVDLEYGIQQTLQRAAEDIKPLFREDDYRIRYQDVEADKEGVTVRIRKADQLELAQTALTKEMGNFDLAVVDDRTLRLTIGEVERDRLRKFYLGQNLVTLRNRVNALGVSEPLVQQQGKNRIVIELPGVQDSAQVKDIIGATATLEYRLPHPEDRSGDMAARAQRTGRAPRGYVLHNRRDGSPVLLKNEVIVRGENLVDAASGLDQNGRPAVSVTLDSAGANRMRKTTRKNTKKPMAVVFIEYESKLVMRDGKEERKLSKVESVISVATIQEEFGRKFQTTGLEPREARQLAVLLRAGALAAPAFVVEERTIGPSMGKENIEKGMTSVVIGFGFVIFFMLLYYRLFGLVANVALFVNLIIIVGVMSLMQATLTLPGIAGIVLTVGMAVDANVLIFERIREELRAGGTVQQSIHAGYEKAILTIADANVTTLIAAMVLFAFGNGPIKGFAITLSIGIVTSMFTAILGTRALINMIYGRRENLKKISI